METIRGFNLGRGTIQREKEGERTNIFENP